MQPSIDKSHSLTAWFWDLLEEAEFCVEPMQLEKSTEWSLVDGTISHRSRRFFQVKGVEWREPEGTLRYQPLVEQREIGILGFVMRDRYGNRPELLVHGKIEPGNVNGVQLAPTCQATASNIARVHGGETPPYSEFFVTRKATVVHQSLQSEQGSRFLGKRNRNVLVQIDCDMAPTAAHRWVDVDEVLELLPLPLYR